MTTTQGAAPIVSDYDSAYYAIAEIETPSGLVLGDVVARLVLDSGAVTPTGPNLGLATTGQILDELRSRIETDYLMGGGGLDYTTVTGRPDAHSEQPATMRRNPQVGDMVRVDNDPGYGIKGAIARVDDMADIGPSIEVAGRRFRLETDNVTVVTYDNATHTWNEVPA